MNIKEYEVEYTYDYDIDVVNIEINRQYNHEKSVALALGVFLDFDEELLPVNLEIVSASKIIGMKKDCLLKPPGNVAVMVNPDTIKVEVKFEFENENKCVQLTALNDYGFPISKTNLAVI